MSNGEETSVDRERRRRREEEAPPAPERGRRNIMAPEEAQGPARPWGPQGGPPTPSFGEGWKQFWNWKVGAPREADPRMDEAMRQYTPTSPGPAERPFVAPGTGEALDRAKGLAPMTARDVARPEVPGPAAAWDPSVLSGGGYLGNAIAAYGRNPSARRSG